MNKYQIYRQLRQHVALAEKRSVLYESNKIAKVLIMLGLSMVVIYLMFIAVILSLIANSSRDYTPGQFFFSLMPLILIVDIFFRTFAQRTPAQMVKPYLLLPLRKYDCVDSFLVSSIVTPNNLLWMFLTVPFVIMSVYFNFGLFPSIAFLINVQLILILNSLFYILCRTLFYSNPLWIFLPLAVYGIMFLPLCWGLNYFIKFYGSLGSMTLQLNPALFCGILFMLILIFCINRIVQYKNISLEIQKDKDLQLKKISSFSFFDRFCQTGEYLKLEIKCMLRNKNTRQTFKFSIIFIVVISLLISFTDMYDDSFSNKFWAVYPFTLLSINLIRIMCPEGNYIECLFIHKENIRSLLEAKYYFYSVMLLLPLVLMIPTIFSGKYSLLFLLSMMAFTAGPMFCVIMQLAVINKVTMPLNTKLTRKNGMETNYIQIIVEMVALFLPVVVLTLFEFFFSDTLAYVLILVIGLFFIAFHKIWIANIYKRMTKCKYENLEGFITSR